MDQPLKVFVHIFNEAGIVAQHDGQPVGELRPTTTWRVGERVIDQFAVRVPPNAGPGACQLRIGLYDQATQARWPAHLPSGEDAEFFVGGNITIK